MLKFSEENQRNWHACKQLLATCLISYISQPELASQVERFNNIFTLGISEPDDHLPLKFDTLSNYRLSISQQLFFASEMEKAKSKNQTKSGSTDFTELQKKFDSENSQLDQEEMLMSSMSDIRVPKEAESGLVEGAIVQPESRMAAFLERFNASRLGVLSPRS